MRTQFDRSPRPILCALSKRQEMVAELVGRGLSNKQIAYQLEITESAVKQHLRGIFARLKISNRTQLALWTLSRIGLYDHDRYDQ